MQLVQSTRGGRALVGGEMDCRVGPLSAPDLARGICCCCCCCCVCEVLGAGAGCGCWVLSRWCCDRQLRVVMSRHSHIHTFPHAVSPGSQAHLSSGSIFAGLCSCAT